MLERVLTHGFFHDGTHSSFRERHHGRPIDRLTLPASRLVTFAQDHDQIGNRATGDRLSATLSPARLAIGAVLNLTTPFTPMLKASPWVVLEYASPDGSRDIAAFFRTSEEGNSFYRFVPRGLDIGRTYRVSFGNTRQSAEFSGDRLLQEGIPLRLESAGTSEMLLFQSK